MSSLKYVRIEQQFFEAYFLTFMYILMILMCLKVLQVPNSDYDNLFLIRPTEDKILLRTYCIQI